MREIERDGTRRKKPRRKIICREMARNITIGDLLEKTSFEIIEKRTRITTCMRTAKAICSRYHTCWMHIRTNLLYMNIRLVINVCHLTFTSGFLVFSSLYTRTLVVVIFFSPLRLYAVSVYNVFAVYLCSMYTGVW